MLREMFEKQAEVNQGTGFNTRALRAYFDPKVPGARLDHYVAAKTEDDNEAI